MSSRGQARGALAVALALAALALALTALLRDSTAEGDGSSTEGPAVTPGVEEAPVPRTGTATAEGPEEVLVEPGIELPPLAPKNDAESREVVRFAAEATLAEVPGLERMLEVEEPLVVGNAIRALGRLGLVTQRSKYAALVEDPRQRVRHEAVRAFGESGDPAALATLVPLLKSEDDVTRQLGLQAIGAIGGSDALSALDGFEPQGQTDAVFLEAARKAATAPARTPAGGN